MKNLVSLILLGCVLSLMAQDPVPTGNTHAVYSILMKNTKTDVSLQPVDMGLSVRWANCNIGAGYPEDYGNYFAWGEVSPKEDYTWHTYIYCEGSSSSVTKYRTNNSYGVIDNKKTLEPMDDAATVILGDKWRIPSRAEWEELKKKCVWVWTTQNGVNGYRVTSKKTGNYIFLPAAGTRNGTELENDGAKGNYWSNTLQNNYYYDAWHLYFSADNFSIDYDGRFTGWSVRAVCPK